MRIHFQVCVSVCVRVFADPLRDSGRRQKSQEWEGEREREGVGAEREGERERQR